MNVEINMLKQKAKILPELPGVYLMKDANERIIYVGKAKILRNRVKSYFLDGQKRASKIYKMLDIIANFDFVVTKNEFEALVLECSLIKQYKPKYNTLLKDGKGYNFIKIGNKKDEWNKITVVKNKLSVNDIYIGPFISSFTVTALINITNEIFKLPTCNKRLSKETKYQKPCLNYYINRCKAPCANKISEVEYNEALRHAYKFIKYGKQNVIKNLVKQMQKLSNNLKFEQAVRVRNIIKALEKIKDNQNIILPLKVDCSVFSFATINNNLYGTVLIFEHGVLKNHESLILNNYEFNEQIESNILMQYYSNSPIIPKYIVVNKFEEDLILVTKYLKESNANFKSIIIVNREDAFELDTNSKKLKTLIKNKNMWKEIYGIAHENAKQEAIRQKNALDAKTDILLELKNVLKLKSIPYIIEAYDISNIANTVIVGGMIVFKNGVPFKSGYRRFKIKSLITVNDYRSMQEIIYRRFKNYRDQNQNFSKGNNFKEKPDLILIDGGKTHVSVVKDVLEALDLNDISVAGLVKDNKHKTKALTNEFTEIELDDNNLFKFITQVQNEVHRFAITYAHIAHRNISLN